MKILLCGKLVSTENIFSISEIEKTTIYETDIDEEYKIDGINTNSFEIDFINGVKYEFNSKGIKFEKNEKVSYLYLDDEEIQLIKLKEFRDSIVKIWMVNQTIIPQFYL